MTSKARFRQEAKVGRPTPQLGPGLIPGARNEVSYWTMCVSVTVLCYGAKNKEIVVGDNAAFCESLFRMMVV